MSEHDAFEMRLEAAVHRYLTAAPLEVDAGAVARRAAAGHPRRRSLADLRPLGLNPSLTWLLLALLLVAVLVGVLLVAGSQRRPLPAVVPPLAAMTECPPGSTPDEPGPVDQLRPMSEQLRMVFDRRARRIVALGSDPSAAWGPWTFDVCTNAWSRYIGFWPRQPWPSDIVSSVYHAGASLTLVLSSDGTLWTPDHTRNAWGAPTYWTEVTHTPEPVGFAGRLVYDPASGLVYVQGIFSGDTAAPPQRLWTYDLETDAWDEVTQTGAVPPGTSGDHLLLVYDTSADRIVAVQSHPVLVRGTWTFDPASGAWTASAGMTPNLNTGWVGSGGEIAFDESGSRTILFSDGLVAAYDARTDRWDVMSEGAAVSSTGLLDGGPLRRLGHWMVYDPLNQRIVVAGGQYRAAEGWVRADDVWGFDPAKEEWIQLLAPSRVERFDEATETWVEVEASAPPD